MNRTLTRILPVAVLGGALLASGAAFSQAHRQPFDGERMLAHMTEQLDLSESQSRAIGEILENGKAQAEADIKRLGEIRQALEGQAADFDAGRTQKLADELGEISARMAYRMTSKHAEIYQLLSPEQRGQMEALRERRREHRDKRWSKHKGQE